MSESRFDPVSAVGHLRERAQSLRGVRPGRDFFRPSSWPNVLLAIVFVCLNVFGAVLNPGHATPVLAVAFIVAQVPCVLLAWRPRLVEWLLVVGLAAWGLTSALGLESGGSAITAIAIYTLGTKRSWRRTVALLVGALLLVNGAEVVTYAQGHRELEPLEYLAGIILSSGVYAGIAALGLYMNTRRAYVRTLVERTQDLERERELLERERDLMTQQAIAVERARIARELHDVVAHHVSVMVIQAGAAEASLPPNSVAAGQALEAIRETGREAMSEMRRLLGLLRSEASIEHGSEFGDSVRSPQPGVKDLEALAERTREAGVDVRLEVSGPPRRIPAAIDLSAYRVAQEALTNTLRHAGPGAAAVLRLRFEPETIVIEVSDDGRGKPSVDAMERRRTGVGHGLVGMRERATLFGGWLEAGPLPGGGYRVLARFPVEAREVSS